MVVEIGLIVAVDVAVVEEECGVEGCMHERAHRLAAQDVHEIVRRLDRVRALRGNSDEVSRSLLIAVANQQSAISNQATATR